MTVSPSDPRVQYIYHFVLGGQSVFAYHRQPGESWRDHRHDYWPATGRPRVTPATVTLREVLIEVTRFLGLLGGPGMWPPRPGAM